MGLFDLWVIILSGFNDVFDFATAWFPGINEMITFIFDAVIAALLYLEFIQKKIQGVKNIHRIIMKKVLILIIASLIESFPVLGLLPLQVVGAVAMAQSGKEQRQ